MQFTPKTSVKKFQQGGPMEQETPTTDQEMPAEGTQEAPAGAEQNPLIMLAEGAMQALQSQDCQIAFQVCQGLMQLVQQAQAPQEGMNEPVFRDGGVIVRRIKK